MSIGENLIELILIHTHTHTHNSEAINLSGLEYAYDVWTTRSPLCMFVSEISSLSRNDPSARR